MHDLTQPVRAGMQVYPGDPEVTCGPALTIERDGVAVSRLQLGSHTGTHVDAPAHVVPDGRFLAEVDLAELCGEALLLRVTVGEGQRYGLPDLTEGAPLPDPLPPIVIIDTGWARHFGTDAALRHPWLDGEAALALVHRGMHVLAVDTHSPDPTVAEETDLAAHRAVLGSDGLVVENLTNLTGLPDRLEVGFFPLRLGGDGAPVRAVAFDERVSSRR